MVSETGRVEVNHIAAVGILFPASNPRRIFIEVKDDGYPIKVFRRNLCPIGGNWVGEHAKADRNTRDTFLREFGEELSLERAISSTLKLDMLLGVKVEEYLTPRNDVVVDDRDIAALAELKNYVASLSQSYADFVHFVPKTVFDSADPENKRGDVRLVSSYFFTPLDDEIWLELERLQYKFGNISNESITLLADVDDIVETGAKICWGHDRALQRFWLDFGVKTAKNLPMVPGIESHYIGRPLRSYDEYLQRFDVLKRP